MSENPLDTSHLTDPATPAHLRELYELLGGRPVLLPIPWERDKETKQMGPTKGPRYDEWQKLTWADTRSAAAVLTYSKKGPNGPQVYKRLNLRETLGDVKNNVGVLLGSPSERREGEDVYRLYSIDIDEDAGVAPFLALNPRLAETLQTVGSRGRNLWVWVKGEVPPTHKLFYKETTDGVTLWKPDKAKPFGEWRSEGGQTVIWGTHPKTSKPYRRDVAKPPLRLASFADIVWPQELYLPWAPRPLSEAEKAQAVGEALKAEHGAPYSITKRGNLDLNQTFFAAWYCARHTVVYSPEEDAFYTYQGDATGLWVKHTDNAVRKELAADLIQFARDNAKPEMINMRTTALESAIVSKIRGFAERWQAWKRERSPKTNRARAIAHLRGCMLDLDEYPPVARPFAPEYMSRNKIDVALDPAAQCPRFLNELLGPAVAAEDIELMQKLAGQILIGVNLSQMFLILTGRAGTGKSTFVKVMQRVIGEVNCGQLRTEHLAERFEVFRIMSKTLVVGNDVPGTFLMNEGAYVLKSLVGGDLMDAEPKNGNECYTIRGEFNILITCNTRLRVKLDGDEDAWRRRLALVPYNAPPPVKPDPNFVENLVAQEASGIVNWMVVGAMKLLADLAQYGKIQLTRAQKDRVESLLAESDSVRDFVRRGCAKTKNTADVLTSEDLLQAYVAWCDVRGWTAMPTKRVEGLLPDLIAQLHQCAKSNDIKRYPGDTAKRGYRGLRLLAAEEIEAASAPRLASQPGGATAAEEDRAAIEATAEGGDDTRASHSEPGTVGARSALDQIGGHAPPPPAAPPSYFPPDEAGMPDVPWGGEESLRGPQEAAGGPAPAHGDDDHTGRNADEAGGGEALR